MRAALALLGCVLLASCGVKGPPHPPTPPALPGALRAEAPPDAGVPPCCRELPDGGLP